MALRSLTYTTGLTLKTVIRDFSSGAEKLWNTGTSAFETYTAGNIANYGISTTEGSPGNYTWTVPALSASALGYQYYATTYSIASTNLATTDLPNRVWLSQFSFDGTNCLEQSNLYEIKNGAIANSGGTITFPNGTLSTYAGGTADSDAATILAQVNKIGTNNADSPNAITAQGAISTNLSVATSTLATASNLTTAQTTLNSINTQASKIGTNSADSPNAITTQNTISTNLNATVGSRSTFSGGAVASVISPVQVDMTQVVPTSNTAQTHGDALNAARAQGFGKWVLTGTSLVLYAGDGVTVVRTFTLDSATVPTLRT